MITATLAELEQAGITERPEAAVADAQYWNEQQMDEVIADKHIQVLIPTDSGGAKEPDPAGPAAGTLDAPRARHRPRARSCTENANR